VTLQGMKQYFSNWHHQWHSYKK